MKQKEKDREKEKAEKIKALRREIEEKLEEQLPAEMAEGQPQVEVQRINEEDLNDPERARQIIEALLFAAGKPLTAAEIRKTVKTMTVSQITETIRALAESYLATGRAFEIVEIAGGFEIATRKEFAPWILKIELQKKAKQVTQSALETLAILAYKQPITRAEIEELRGVDVSGVMTTLVERSLIKIVGKKEVPGRPFLYGTTEKFLEHFGLSSLKDLPDIQEIQTLVESSVKRDTLLGTTNMVDVPADGTGGEAVDQESSGEQDVPEEVIEEESAEQSEEDAAAAENEEEPSEKP